MAAGASDLLEVLNGIARIENRLQRDVEEFCGLLNFILKSLREGGVDLRLQENRSLQSNFVDIYMCLKLHLAFHLGDVSALPLAELSLLGSRLSQEPEVNPQARHAIDPGGKLLEIVSMQIIFSVRGT